MRKRSISKVGTFVPYLIILAVSMLLFILIDILQVNNFTNTWVFLNSGNILNILYQVSINAIMAFGMTVVIIVAGIDLSVGSLVSIAGVMVCVLMSILNVPLFPAILITLFAGMVIGLFTGFIISRFDMPPFVATLGTMILVRGVSFILVDGNSVFNEAKPFLFIGNEEFLAIPFPIIIMMVIFGFFHYLLKYSRFGRFVYAIGGNEEAAKLSGINVGKVKLIIYALSSMAAAVSGIILASRLGSGQPLSGEGYELDVITAVVIGGASLAGGVGTISGTLAGAIIIGLISNGMNLLSIQPYLQWVIKGSLILLVVIFKRQIGEKQKQHQLIVTEHEEYPA